VDSVVEAIPEGIVVSSCQEKDHNSVTKEDSNLEEPQQESSRVWPIKNNKKDLVSSAVPENSSKRITSMDLENS
jgi:hypothetical protein